MVNYGKVSCYIPPEYGWRAYRPQGYVASTCPPPRTPAAFLRAPPSAEKADTRCSTWKSEACRSQELPVPVPVSVSVSVPEPRSSPLHHPSTPPPNCCLPSPASAHVHLAASVHHSLACVCMCEGGGGGGRVLSVFVCVFVNLVSTCCQACSTQRTRARRKKGRAKRRQIRLHIRAKTLSMGSRVSRQPRSSTHPAAMHMPTFSPLSPSGHVGTPCAPCTDARALGVPRSSRQPPPHKRPLPPNTPWTRARTGHARAWRNSPRATPCGANRRATVGGACAAALMHSALLERRAPTAATPGFWTKPTMLCERRAGKRMDCGFSAEAFRSGGVCSKQKHGQKQAGTEMLASQRGGGTPVYHGMPCPRPSRLRVRKEPGGETRRQPGRRDAPSVHTRWPAAER